MFAFCKCYLEGNPRKELHEQKYSIHFKFFKECIPQVLLGLFLNTSSVLSRRFYLTGDMANLYPFIQGSLEWPFSELFSANTNILHLTFPRAQFRSFRIRFSHYRNIWWKNKWINHTWNIMSKRHNILSTKTSFFISSAGKTESVQEFKIKLLE